MDNREKLRHLAAHWEEHNRNHAETYRTWAIKMKESGGNAVAELLDEIADRTSDLDRLFHDLLEALQ